MVRASSIGCVLALSAVGCGSDDLFLGFPHLEGASAVVLAVPQNGELDLYAASLVGSRLRVRFDYDGVDPIQALVFDRTLEELGIPEGALERPGPGDDAGELAALDPIGSYIARIEEKIAEWIEDPALAAKEARYKKPPSLCVTFSAPTRIGGLNGSLTFALPIDDQHALLGSRDGELAIVSQAGLTLVDPPFAGYVRSAFKDGDKVYLSQWFNGGMYTGDLSPTEGITNLVQLPDSPLAAGAAALAGGDGTIIAASEEGEAAWFDGTSWKSLPTIPSNDTIMRAAWTPEESFYWARASSSLVRVDPQGNARTENVDLGGGVYSIAPIEGIGTVLGTGDGNFLQRNESGWAGLGGDYGWWGIDLEPYAGGFFFLLASGSVGQYRPDPDEPLCTDHSVLGFINDGQLVKLGDHLLAAGWDGNLPTDIVIAEF